MMIQDLIVILLVTIIKMTAISPKAGTDLWREHEWTQNVLLQAITTATLLISGI